MTGADLTQQRAKVIGRILSLGFPLPGTHVDNYTFLSAPAFFDYDAIVVDPLDELAEQIVASVNVADRIDELAPSEPRRRGRWASPEAVEQ